MEAMASSPEKTQSGPSSPLADLHDRLDTLWISYLRNLDEYTAAQKTIQDQLRSGFFSLSRANFNARPGTRYGGDYFHDRAVATRRVTRKQDHEEGGDGKMKLAIFQHSPVLDNDDHGSDGEKAAADKGLQQPSPPATPSSKDAKAETPTESFDEQSEETQEKYRDTRTEKLKPKLPLEADPLRWFGILVPQELRSAQTSFSLAMDDGIAQAVNAGRAMRKNEVEIRKLRKDIRRAERAEKS